MKKPLFILILLAFAACTEISFQEPQPKDKKSLTTVPPSLRGSYLLKDENGSVKDTLTVTARGYVVGHNRTEEASLSDSLILKYYKGYYFLNMNEKPEWFLRVLKQEKNGDLIYMDMDHDSQNFNPFIARLSKEIRVDSLEVKGEKLYQIDPSPKQLISLIKKGFFKKTVLQKMKP